MAGVAASTMVGEKPLVPTSPNGGESQGGPEKRVDTVEEGVYGAWMIAPKVARRSFAPRNQSVGDNAKKSLKEKGVGKSKFDVLGELNFHDEIAPSEGVREKGRDDVPPPMPRPPKVWKPKAKQGGSSTSRGDDVEVVPDSQPDMSMEVEHIPKKVNEAKTTLEEQPGMNMEVEFIPTKENGEMTKVEEQAAKEVMGDKVVSPFVGYSLDIIREKVGGN